MFPQGVQGRQSHSNRAECPASAPFPQRKVVMIIIKNWLKIIILIHIFMQMIKLWTDFHYLLKISDAKPEKGSKNHPAQVVGDDGKDVTPKALFSGALHEKASQMKLGDDVASSNDFRSLNSIFQTGMGTTQHAGMSIFGRSVLESRNSLRSMQSHIMHRKRRKTELLATMHNLNHQISESIWRESLPKSFT